VVVGVLLAAPLLVEVAARGLGAPVQRQRAIVARLAREQVLRAPTRTAVSASSLTIGLALVLLVTAYATALRAAARDAVAASFRGDLAIEARDGVSPIPAASVQAAASAPGLLGLSSLRTAQATLARAGTVTVDAVEPSTWGSVYRFDWLDGSASALAALGPGDALVEEDIAQVAHLRVGDHMVLIGGQGQRVRANVRGVYRDPGLLRGVVLDAAWFAQEFHQPRLRAVFVRVGAGAGGATAAVREALRAFPGVVVRSPGALAGEAGRDAANVVGLLYALLGLSLLMALSGIAGTLTLSVHERTRELGLLRALGMTRSQARALVRDEALISAGVGSVSGLALGLALGWTVVHAEAPEGLTFTLPWPWLIGAAAVGIAAGVLGAVGPGRRAARLDVLAAIAHE
jgi:putative ABC transport system permease protein